MSFRYHDDARHLLEELIKQPEQFIFGAHKAIFNTVLALVTPVPRDCEAGKEYAQAHVYLLDKPGVGKTAILVHLSTAIKARLGQKIEGRSDLMPSDFIGRENVDRITGVRTVLKGPIHSNICFFDEINRATSKSQSPFLGAMEGGHVIMNVTNLETGRIEAKPFPLYPISDDPSETRMFFIVMATANPIELEGTYPLSEAQKERFTYSFKIGLPSRTAEMMIRAKNVMRNKVKVVMDLATLLEISDLVKNIELSPQAHEYMMRLIENSRPYSQDMEDYGELRDRHATTGLVEFVNEYVANGCSPRRDLHMEAAAKAWAFMRGEDNVATVDDIKAIAPITMQHVILLQPRSLGDDITTRKVVDRILVETEAVT